MSTGASEIEQGGFQILDAEGEEIDEDADEDEDEVIDVGGPGLVKRGSVTLADEAGEWIQAKAESDTQRFAGPSRDLYQAFTRQATAIPRLTAMSL